MKKATTRYPVIRVVIEAKKRGQADLNVHIRLSKKEAKIETAFLEACRLESPDNIGSAPGGLDEPYRVFISEDPIGLAGGINQFAYTLNDPMNFADPLGLKCKKSFWARVGENFWLTNKTIPGVLAPHFIPGVSVGLLTGGKVAEFVGGITLRQWAMLGFRGATLQGVAFTGLETGIIAAATAATNFAVVGAAWETGAGIGSIISAAILPCEEEIEPPKPKGCK
jgi:hypothetical protein